MGKRRSSRRSPGKKRALGPYMLFCKANRKNIVKKHPSASFGQIGRFLGSAWNKLSPKEKQAYQRKAGRGRSRSRKSR